MIQDSFAAGEPVCWPDEDGVWRHGTVRETVDGWLSVEDDKTDSVERIDASVGCLSPPTIPYKNSAHPKTPESRVFLHAVCDAMEEVGVHWDDVGLVWDGETPTVVFANTVADGRINAVRHAVESRTPADIAPTRRECTTLQL